MSLFGEKLKSCITARNFTVYRLAKYTGIERTGLHRAISGQRLISEESLYKIIDFLHLEYSEKEDLLEAYAIEAIGANSYSQRKILFHLIESLTSVCQPVIRPISVEKQLKISFDGLTAQPVLLRGKYHIINFLQTYIEHEFYESDCPTLYLFTAPDRNLWRRIIPTYASSSVPETHCGGVSKKKPVVRHLVPLSETDDKSDKICSNLEILDMLLPFSLSVGLDYEIHYYYDYCRPHSYYGYIFPYYIILNNRVILLSEDLETAGIYSDEEYVSYYKEEFEKRLKLSSTLIHTFNRMDDILKHFAAIMKHEPGKCCLIEYEPCFIAYADPDIVNRALIPGAADREAILHFVKDRISWLQSLENSVWLFTLEGLEYFMKTGISTDIPQEITVPLPMADRLTLVKRLYHTCEKDVQKIRIINSELFMLPEFVSISITEYFGIDFYLFTQGSDSKYLSITETTLAQAFKDFSLGLLDSSLVYTKEKTLALLEDCLLKYT